MVKVKRKGAYEFENLGYHQNQGGLVIPKAAEAALIYGADIDEFINNHTNKFDFLMRCKVPRSSKLVLTVADVDGNLLDIPQQNICRYYVSHEGGNLTKIMPALEGKDKTIKIFLTDKGEEFEAVTKAQLERAEKRQWEFLREYIDPAQERRIGIETGWNVKPCNDITKFEWDINYDYYITEARKLVLPLLQE